MEPSDQDEAKRAVEGQAIGARLEADRYKRKLRERPLWRFRRRQAINKALAKAHTREQEARRLLDEADTGPR